MSLDDERVQFYLRHAEQIEQWASLRSAAASAVDGWLADLVPHIEELARELGSDVRVGVNVGDDVGYPLYRLTHSAWGFDGQDDPPASIALEWVRARTTISGASKPYVGLRAPKTHDIGARLRASEAVAQARRGRRDTSNAWWVGYSFVSPEGDFASDRDGYRDRLLGALRAAWEAYAPGVSAAVEVAGNAGRA